MIRLFLETVRFEVAFYRGRISTAVYFGMFLALGMLLMALFGGAIPGAQAGILGSGGNVHVNSPYVLAIVTAIISLISVLVTAALAGNSVYRDFEAGIHPLFFTSPITKASYLGGRFTGAILVNALVLLAIPAGLLLGSALPNLDAARFGPVQLWAYIHPYLVIVLPNLLFTGAIFFALAALTRQMVPNYVGGVLLMVGYLIASSLTRDLQNRKLAALVDPFGMEALDQATKYWTPAEKNSLFLPLTGDFGLNRLLWMGVGLALFALLFARFRFSHAAAAGRRAREVAAPAAGPSAIRIPTPERRFGAGAHLLQFRRIARRSFGEIVGNRYFYGIVGGGLLFLVIAARETGKMYGTTTWPVTYAVIETLGGTFGLFMLIIISFYAGELVWRERDVRIHQVADATPVPTWVPYLAKLSALAGVVLVLQATILAAGLATQAAKGYTRFELELYLKALFGMQLVDYLLLCAMVMAVHVAVNHKYVGHLLVVLYFLFTMFMSAFGLEHNLYRYGSDAGATYSDMNRYGPFVAPFGWFKLYWAGWAILLAVLSNLFWVRGMETGAAWRARLARVRFARPAASAALLGGALVLGLGGFIFYNTNVLNEFRTGRQVERAQAAYERTYRRWMGRPQPRIAAVEVAVDIHPEERRARARGSYRLLNRHATPIDTVFLRVPPQVRLRGVRFGGGGERVHSDDDVGVFLYRLARPLAPGDSTTLEFDLELGARGFENRVGRLEVVQNGTFFNSGSFPHFGYDEQGELQDDDIRRRNGLRPRERMRPPEDPAARRDNYVSGDSDWMRFAVTLSTSEDQIALAPGYLTREWRQGGRRYFRYEMDAPILGFYAFLSARYQVKRDRWVPPGGGDPVAIEVYHHPAHAYNVDRMILATQRSLDYFTRAFGPYQHRQVRILEFPRYATFAQSFPNTIPYSEGIGFIARLDGPDAIDYPFYVTAHEVAHQWWAHQVIGADAQGSTLLSETLSQYSALMVMEREYGRDRMERFLEYELDQYLAGRSLERKREMPLLRVENQPYIHYRKGSLVMYALRDYLGEETVNRVLREYVRDAGFQGPPYTTSLELYERLRAATPDSLRPVVADLFERITLWDLRTRTARSRRRPDGRWEVVLEVEAGKAYADSLGVETAAPVAEAIDIGVFAPATEGRGDPLYLARHRLRSGRQTITVVVPREPARAGVDPYHKLIDRHSDDNTVAVQSAAD